MWPWPSKTAAGSSSGAAGEAAVKDQLKGRLLTHISRSDWSWKAVMMMASMDETVLALMETRRLMNLEMMSARRQAGYSLSPTPAS